MKKLMSAALALMLLLALESGARAQEEGWYDEARVFKLYDGQGAYLTSFAGEVSVGDEYIAGDDALYRVTSVDGAGGTAVAERTAQEAQADAPAMARKKGGKKRVCMYSTHSDESYQPSDGASSKKQDAGIYDVGEALKKNLEAKGVEVTYSHDTFLPHDAGAYRRSRDTAAQLLKSAPAALFDLHRDGIPDPDEYNVELNGQPATKVRLLVGRSNANAGANRAFAKQIKAAADKKYPGLIKDIFIGKGNYNQELYPQTLLLEFGTHTTEKERAVTSTKFMADVLDGVLFGQGAQAAEGEKNEAGARGSAWMAGLAALAVLLLILFSTGSFAQLGEKLSRGASEVTGGLIGKKPGEEEKEE